MAGLVQRFDDLTKAGLAALTTAQDRFAEAEQTFITEVGRIARHRAKFDDKIRDAMGALVDAQDHFTVAARQDGTLTRRAPRNAPPGRGSGHSDSTVHAVTMHDAWLTARLNELLDATAALEDLAERCGQPPQVTAVRSTANLDDQTTAIHQQWADARVTELRAIASELADLAGRCKGFPGQDAPTDPTVPDVDTCANPVCWRTDLEEIKDKAGNVTGHRSRCSACRRYRSSHGTERPEELCERDRQRKVYS